MVEVSERVPVRAGATVGGIDFQVEPRRAASLSNITTYSFPFGNNAPGVHPAFLDLTARDVLLVAAGEVWPPRCRNSRSKPWAWTIANPRHWPLQADPRFARCNFSGAIRRLRCDPAVTHAMALPAAVLAS
ncbi:MAG: hypothetical protein R2748_02065 [Bryobacterales bacterium]